MNQAQRTSLRREGIVGGWFVARVAAGGRRMTDAIKPAKHGKAAA
jgi:hypothetical protein